MSTIYLYVKQHNITGLKYFGKTAKNPYAYSGSGLYWRRHIKTHGNDVTTSEVWGFDDVESCVAFAIRFSEYNNIVESQEWANLKPENGLDGAVVGMRHNESTKQKIKTTQAILKWNVGRTHSEKTKAKIGDGNRGKVVTTETKNKIRNTRIGTIASEETKSKIQKARALQDAPMLGKNHSEDAKARMSLAAQGKRWFNDGIKSYIISLRNTHLVEELSLIPGRLTPKT